MNTKETIKSNFEAGDVPTELDFAEAIDSQVGVLDSSAELPTASASNFGVCYLVGGNTIYRCELDNGNYDWVSYPFTTASVNDYLNLTHKPSINGHVLGRSNSSADIGVAPAAHTHNYAGSDSAGGAANSVKGKLLLSIGGEEIFRYKGDEDTVVDVYDELSDVSASISENMLLIVSDTQGTTGTISIKNLIDYINS